MAPEYGSESSVVAAKQPMRWMAPALRPSSISFGAISGREMSWPVDEPPVSMHMTATTIAHISMGDISMLTIALSMEVKASVLVTTPAKPHIAATVIDMCIDSAAPVLSSSRMLESLSWFQKSAMDTTTLIIIQILISTPTTLKRMNRMMSGKMATMNLGLGEFSS